VDGWPDASFAFVAAAFRLAFPLFTLKVAARHNSHFDAVRKGAPPPDRASYNQPTFGEDSMRTRIACLLTCVFALTTSGRDSVPSLVTPDLEPSSVASIHVDKHSFKSGEEIKLIILLEAGIGGVYIPKWWGELGGGIPGFAVNLTTLSGTSAETCGHSSDAGPTHEPDATVVLNRDFIYLPQQHIIGLKTVIDCPTKRPGKYLINAFYSPTHFDADEVARLPQTHGLVLRKSVQAKPIAISIY
jgi:hypothetical protein